MPAHQLTFKKTVFQMCVLFLFVFSGSVQFPGISSMYLASEACILLCWVKTMVCVQLTWPLTLLTIIIGTFKDVRAQNVPTYRFSLNLPRRKVMIYFCQKGKKKKKRRVTALVFEIMKCTFRRLRYFILRRSYLTTVSNKKATLVKFRSGKRTQFNITNITKLTFAADVFF